VSTRGYLICAIFRCPSSISQQRRPCRAALIDTEFVLGSAAPHEHDLVLGYYSVHTSPHALRNAEAHISSIQKRLVQEGRL
jgi:hypothetical protein